MHKPQAAQNQHYVPKFILRKFLSNAKKEQVTVFQKSTSKPFATSIDNIMAERRFYEFLIDDDYYLSFENGVCSVEDAILKPYEKLVESQRLERTPRENELLGLFIAFQMMRTRSYRDSLADVGTQFREHLLGRGFLPEQMLELEEGTPDEQKKTHLRSIQDGIKDFSAVIAAKDFLLIRAPEGRHFYLADNPVALHNDGKLDTFYGNMGLTAKGIQIHLPLTSKLMLVAWCPTILKLLRENLAKRKREAQHTLAYVTLSQRPLSAEKRLTFDREMLNLKESMKAMEDFVTTVEAGAPIIATQENMDFYNTMQVGNARDFVICQSGDFGLASSFVAKWGKTGGGLRFRVG